LRVARALKLCSGKSGLGGRGLSRSRRFRLQGVLGNLDQFAKRGVILRGDICEHLPIEGDFGCFQSLNEAAIRYPGRSCRRIDADLPEPPESSLFGFTVPECVLAPVVYGIRSVPIQFGTFETEAFSGLKHPPATFAGGWGIGNAHNS
jgi:hypothetical protein